MLKRSLSVLAGAVLAAAGFVGAYAVELRESHPETYTVQAGDTLWDIARRFLKSPWNWPEIWQANPQVENPHRIYPGDVLSLVYIDGKPALVADSGPTRLSPQVREQRLEDAVPPIRLNDIRPFLEVPRVITEEARRAAPYVVASEENRLMGQRNRLVYVRQLGDVEPGTRMTLARASIVYREVPAHYPWSGGRRKRTAEEFEHTFNISSRDVRRFFWRDWVYEHNSELLGYEYLQFGEVEVVKGGDPATVRVIGSDHEVAAGDILLPVENNPFDAEFAPRPPSAPPEGGRVLATADTLYGVGYRQVVVINRGRREGVVNGEVYGVFQPGEKVRDTVRYPKEDHAFSFFLRDKKTHVQLPAEFAGNVMVFKAFETVSYALVMDGEKPVRAGAALGMPQD
jgi:hypothetical protein